MVKSVCSKKYFDVIYISVSVRRVLLGLSLIQKHVLNYCDQFSEDVEVTYPDNRGMVNAVRREGARSQTSL